MFIDQMPRSINKGMLSLLFTFIALAVAGAPANAAVHVAAVGDIACAKSAAVTPTKCQQQAVADSIARVNPDSVWLLGDNQYTTGKLSDFQTSFDPAFGRFANIWRPAPGNHEYFTPGASGYYDYFGAAAGPARRGYYSFNVGSWHVVSLNSTCEVTYDCSATSAQIKWLKTDLARNPSKCLAAFWHAPYYSSGNEHGSSPAMREAWKALRAHRAEFVLSGHDHDYEYFRPQNANAKLDRSSRGIRQFVVGTGGKENRAFNRPEPNSVDRYVGGFGFLSMTLRKRSYSWRFVTTGGAKLFSRSARCH